MEAYSWYPPDFTQCASSLHQFCFVSFFCKKSYLGVQLCADSYKSSQQIIKFGGGLGEPPFHIYVLSKSNFRIQINKMKLPPRNLDLKLDMTKSTKSKGVTFPNFPIFFLLLLISMNDRHSNE